MNARLSCAMYMNARLSCAMYMNTRCSFSRRYVHVRHLGRLIPSRAGRATGTCSTFIINYATLRIYIKLIKLQCIRSLYIARLLPPRRPIESRHVQWARSALWTITGRTLNITSRVGSTFTPEGAQVHRSATNSDRRCTVHRFHARI